MPSFVPVVICGGRGVRLWPLSRQDYPKPFIQLPQQRQPLIRDTYSRLRCEGMPSVAAVVTVTEAGYVPYCQSAYNDANLDYPHIIVAEPNGANTAAAIASAAKVVQDRFGDESVMVVMPADHLIDNHQNLAQTFSAAVENVADKVGLIGILPDCPHTGYGYIRRGRAINKDMFEVVTFIEKPDKDRAQQLLDEQNTFWNSGIFCLTAATALAELQRHAPDIFGQIENIYRECDMGGDVIAPDVALYRQLPSRSFDYAVAEKTDNAIILSGEGIGWSDMGTWQTVLAKATAKDGEGNSVVGDGYMLGCQRSLVVGEQRCIVALGLQDTVVVDTADALLVASVEHLESLKEAVESLQDREVAKSPATVIRPWGAYTVINEGVGYKVKRIDVKAGGVLSYQSHQHRAERWTVVEGEIIVVLEGEEIPLKTGESCQIPLGAKHRIINRTEQNAALIEVQIGDYLGEDDIVRYEDIYGR